MNSWPSLAVNRTYQKRVEISVKQAHYFFAGKKTDVVRWKTQPRTLSFSPLASTSSWSSPPVHNSGFVRHVLVDPGHGLNWSCGGLRLGSATAQEPGCCHVQSPL